MREKAIMHDMENYYVISHLVQFTGLSDRTIRNYIALGVLEGEKIDGVWHFTPEQVEEFITHPTVRPSVLAKNNGLVYDFLLNEKKEKQEMCVILDIPGKEKVEVGEFFCRNITDGDYHNIKFSFDGARKKEPARIILKGDAGEV